MRVNFHLRFPFRLIAFTTLGGALLYSSNLLAKHVKKPPPPRSVAWSDDFSGPTLNTNFWVVSSEQAPGYIANDHIGYYDPSHVQFVSDDAGGSYLRLELNQERGQVGTNPYGVISRGAIVYSKNTYGYGTYEWRMRMSSTAARPTDPGSTVSGSVSAGFVYVNNSQTEIDFEFSALPSTLDMLYMVNWYNATPRTGPTADDETYSTLYPIYLTDNFYDYKFVWTSASISYYVNNVLQKVHTTNIPSAPAYFMINHWGTDSNGWGGVATLDTPRYFYVDRASFTPE